MVNTSIVLSSIIIFANLLLTLTLHVLWLRLNSKASLLESKIEKLEITKLQLKRIKRLEALAEPKQSKKKTPFEVFWHDNLYNLSSREND